MITAMKEFPTMARRSNKQDADIFPTFAAVDSWIRGHISLLFVAFELKFRSFDMFCER